ncbi:hypothetical protein ACVWZW_002169 [Bradyrhizobium sp. F1.13.4]
MAQFGESGLFEQVLRAGNAGSIAFQGWHSRKGLQMQYSLSST